MVGKQRHHHRMGLEERETPISNGGQLRFLPSLWMSLRNPFFLLLAFSNAIFFLASVINATLAVHYLTYYARITQSNALSLFQSSFYAGGLIGVFFWLRLARKVEKQHIYVGATLILALLMVAAYLLVGEGHLLGLRTGIPDQGRAIAWATGSAAASSDHGGAQGIPRCRLPRVGRRRRTGWAGRSRRPCRARPGHGTRPRCPRWRCPDHRASRLGPGIDAAVPDRWQDRPPLETGWLAG